MGAWTPRNPASTTSPITIGGLANGTAYRVKLRAVNAAGAGPSPSCRRWSSLHSPDRTNHHVCHPWQRHGEHRVLAARVERRRGDHQLQVLAGQRRHLAHPVADVHGESAPAGRPAQRAYLSGGAAGPEPRRDGAASLPVSVTPRTVPDAPTGVAVAAVGTSSAVLSFTAPLSDGGAAVTNYEYALSIDNGATWASWLPLAPPDAVSPITIVGLVNGTTYRAKLRAVNAAGAGPESTMSSVFMPRTVPGAPTLTGLRRATPSRRSRSRRRRPTAASRSPTTSTRPTTARRGRRGRRPRPPRR